VGAEGWDLKTRPKGGGRRSAGLDPRVPIEREPGGGAARVRLGSYEFQKRGISRFDLRDPYRIAVALTWPQFLAALPVSDSECRLRHTLLAGPGLGRECPAEQLHGRLFLQRRASGDGRLRRDVSLYVVRPCGRDDRDHMRAWVHRNLDWPHFRPLLAATR